MPTGFEKKKTNSTDQRMCQRWPQLYPKQTHRRNILENGDCEEGKIEKPVEIRRTVPDVEIKLSKQI